MIGKALTVLLYVHGKFGDCDSYSVIPFIFIVD
jgi:hypothetical protein